MIRLTKQQIIELHKDVIAQSGGSPEIRDEFWYQCSVVTLRLLWLLIRSEGLMIKIKNYAIA